MGNAPGLSLIRWIWWRLNEAFALKVARNGREGMEGTEERPHRESAKAGRHGELGKSQQAANRRAEIGTIELLCC